MRKFLDIVKDETMLNGAIKASCGYKHRELWIKTIELKITIVNSIPLCKNMYLIHSLEKELLDAKEAMKNYIESFKQF